MSVALEIRDGTLLRHGAGDDFLAIDSLRKREGSALGFLPRAVYESVLLQVPDGGRMRWRYMDCVVTEDNGDFTGFCFTSYAAAEAKVVQIVVRQDARRWHRALLMLDHVETEARKRHRHGLTCRVASDLESNLFWRGCGFTLESVETSTWLNQRESNSRRPLNIYRKLFAGAPTQSVLL